jgi:hypothetical protein
MGGVGVAAVGLRVGAGTERPALDVGAGVRSLDAGLPHATTTASRTVSRTLRLTDHPTVVQWQAQSIIEDLDPGTGALGRQPADPLRVPHLAFDEWPYLVEDTLLRQADVQGGMVAREPREIGIRRMRRLGDLRLDGLEDHPDSYPFAEGGQPTRGISQVRTDHRRLSRSDGFVHGGVFDDDAHLTGVLEGQSLIDERLEDDEAIDMTNAPTVQDRCIRLEVVTRDRRAIPVVKDRAVILSRWPAARGGRGPSRSRPR